MVVANGYGATGLFKEILTIPVHPVDPSMRDWFHSERQAAD